MKANHNLASCLIVPKQVCLRCQRYEMKANHNLKTFQLSNFLSVFKMSKIQNETNSQPPLHIIPRLAKCV